MNIGYQKFGWKNSTLPGSNNSKIKQLDKGEKNENQPKTSFKAGAILF